MSRLTLLCAFAFLCAATSFHLNASETTEAAQVAVDRIQEVDFNRHIRPILSNNCFFCHGPDEAKREGDLRLDIREDAIEAFAFVPGDTEEGELLLRIFSDDPDERMPEPSSNKSLTETEKLLLKRWIGEGAKYDGHWSYNPIIKPTYNNIDAIVGDQLEQHGLNLSPEAEKETQIRRVYLDLIGLPPSPEEVEAFMKDRSSRAYEKVVDRLLSSKRYGEKMAIHWLDAVRYSDTVGYHGDQERDATPYRDYVIESFNENKPYDQFTIEQIAGDLLPNPTLKQLVASSYNRINQLSREGGIQDKEYVKKYQAERVRTTATTWLGSTMACCECHDHKFDPFKTKDFYSMAAFFADILEKGAYTGNGAYQEEVQPLMKEGLSHEGWFGPELTVPNVLFHENPEALTSDIQRQEAALAKGSPEAEIEFEQWLKLQTELNERSVPRHFPVPYRSDFNETAKTETIDVSSYPYSLDETAALHFEARMVGGGGRGSMGIEVTYVADEEESKRAFFLGDNFEGELDNKTKAPWIILVAPKPYKGVWHPVKLTRDVLNLPKGAKITSLLPLKGNSSGFRNFQFRTMRKGSQSTALSEVGALILEKVQNGEASKRELNQLKEEFFISHADTFYDERSAIDALKKELHGNRYTPLTVSAKTREVRVLPRGNWMDDSGEVVLPASPGFLPNPIASTEEKRLNRLDLAEWIVHPDNPLTARTFVNRIWALYFGTPLSSAAEDLGQQGEYPPYPGLLDFLAKEFIESGWDIKRLVHLIVNSKTYRQTSDASDELFELDPYNRLLARQSPVRLSAEIIRDNALMISGLLNTKMGGQAARPYQPPGHYRNLNFPRREYIPDQDENQYRRGVYVHWQRTFLHPMMTTFDANGRDECVVKRDMSNTPLQALNLLNDPTQVEAAKALAEMLLSSEKDDDSRIDAVFTRALARKPTPKERQTLTAFLQRERARFQNEENQADAFLKVGLRIPDSDHPPVELAALTSMSRAILNLHETITRY
ncbi:MAG: PSD1 and planctomycete cytochrome C domain-containing protein [Verrucomicrobia bacterium]|nr:PSD1 and planctomycete cytochrome C domain-containing protein [Verrucomicrobiota bacterium]